jgi:carnosine N-methyltransferase
MNQVRKKSSRAKQPNSRQLSDWKDLVCPKCKAVLTQSHKQLDCKPCGLSFLKSSEVIPFFDDPDRAIATSYVSLFQSISRWRNQSVQLAETLKTSNRKKVLLPLLKAQKDNQRIFEGWASKLEALVKPAILIEQATAKTPASYGYNFSYLERDWVNPPTETNHVVNGLKRCLRLIGERGRACILGMGAGRFGLELTHYFDNIWGIDDSFGQVLQYHELLNHEIAFWQVNTKNQVHHNGMIKKLTASMPATLKARATAVNYLWADALNSPFSDDYFDWVFSIYFTDVKPLPELVKEVKRILRPGGLFLHFGPLEYHFKNVEHHYGFNEFKEYFLDNGFELVHESTSSPSPVARQQSSLVSKSQYIDKVLLLRLCQ